MRLIKNQLPVQRLSRSACATKPSTRRAFCCPLPRTPIRPPSSIVHGLIQNPIRCFTTAAPASATSRRVLASACAPCSACRPPQCQSKRRPRPPTGRKTWRTATSCPAPSTRPRMSRSSRERVAGLGLVMHDPLPSRWEPLPSSPTPPPAVRNHPVSLNVDHLRRTADTLEQAILRLAEITSDEDVLYDLYRNAAIRGFRGVL